MIEAARLLNPDIEVADRSHNEQEAVLLEREGAGKVFVGEGDWRDPWPALFLLASRPPVALKR